MHACLSSCVENLLTNGVKQVGYAAGLVVQYYSDEL